MRIGIDGRALQGTRTGIGRYVTDLCRELDLLLPGAFFFVYSNIPLRMPVISGRWILKIENIAFLRKIKPIFWFKLRCGVLCKEDNLDVFWAAATFFPRLSPSVRTVATVYDLNYKVVPATMPNKLRWTFKLFFERDVVGADEVVAISQGTSDRLAYYTGRVADAVVYPTVSASFQPQDQERIKDILLRYGLAQPYILAVATWEPRKNLELLIKVFMDMKRRGLLGGIKLVLVGSRGWKDKRMFQLYAKTEDVIALGYIPDEDLPTLYSGAQLFVFPSFYEGFGMPVLEARHCGTAVVASDIPELREAGGDGTIYISPTKEGIERGILQALQMTHVQRKCICHPTLRESAKILSSSFARQ